MIPILFHLIGDYLLQNDWIAKNKGRMTNTGFLACLIHVVLYTLPFAIYYQSLRATLIICLSHFLIDKFALAKYWVALINWKWDGENYGFDNEKPIWLSLWLLIIFDNIFHLICNYIAITYFL